MCEVGVGIFRALPPFGASAANGGPPTNNLAADWQEEGKHHVDDMLHGRILSARHAPRRNTALCSLPRSMRLARRVPQARLEQRGLRPDAGGGVVRHPGGLLQPHRAPLTSPSSLNGSCALHCPPSHCVSAAPPPLALRYLGTFRRFHQPKVSRNQKHKACSGWCPPPRSLATASLSLSACPSPGGSVPSMKPCRGECCHAVSGSALAECSQRSQYLHSSCSGAPIVRFSLCGVALPLWRVTRHFPRTGEIRASFFFRELCLGQTQPESKLTPDCLPY